MNRIRRIIIAAIVILLAIGGSSVQPAYAITWDIFDGFTNNPQTRWHCWVNPFASDCEFNPTTPTHLATYPGSVDLWIRNNDVDWTDVGKQFSFIPFYSGMSCKASFWVQGSGRESWYAGGRDTTFSGRLEVIDVATWTYINVTPFTLPPSGDTWSSVATTYWYPPRKDIYVRIGLIAPPDTSYTSIKYFMTVDDSRVRCTY
jgi:hypothetical protein